MNDKGNEFDSDFEDVYNRNIDMVFRICMLYLKNEEDASDAVQTVFLKYLISKKIPSDPGHEKAWFIITARNHSLDILKSFWRSKRKSSVELERVGYYDKCEESPLMKKIFELKDKYKEVLYLFYFEGYKVKEISSILGKSDITVKKRLAKAREILKINLGGYYE